MKEFKLTKRRVFVISKTNKLSLLGTICEYGFNKLRELISFRRGPIRKENTVKSTIIRLIS